jgi:hypothetical protein
MWLVIERLLHYGAAMVSGLVLLLQLTAPIDAPVATAAPLPAPAVTLEAALSRVGTGAWWVWSARTAGGALSSQGEQGVRAARALPYGGVPATAAMAVPALVADVFGRE